MKAMLAAVAAIAIIAVGAYLGLEFIEYSAADRTTGDSVRLD